MLNYCHVKDELSVVILSEAKRNRRISDPSTHSTALSAGPAQDDRKRGDTVVSSLT